MTDPMELVGRLERVVSDRRPGFSLNADPQLLTEAAACIREMVEWRDIETAPRDGTMFLVGYDNKIAKRARLEAHRRVYEARWCERQQSFAARNGFILHDGATHWLPLPPAPGAEDE